MEQSRGCGENRTRGWLQLDGNLDFHLMVLRYIFYQFLNHFFSPLTYKQKALICFYLAEQRRPHKEMKYARAATEGASCEAQMEKLERHSCLGKHWQAEKCVWVQVWLLFCCYFLPLLGHRIAGLWETSRLVQESDMSVADTAQRSLLMTQWIFLSDYMWQSC